jgi:hypothetical protein
MEMLTTKMTSHLLLNPKLNQCFGQTELLFKMRNDRRTQDDKAEVFPPLIDSWLAYATSMYDPSLFSLLNIRFHSIRIGLRFDFKGIHSPILLTTFQLQG